MIGVLLFPFSGNLRIIYNIVKYNRFTVSLGEAKSTPSVESYDCMLGIAQTEQRR